MAQSISQESINATGLPGATAASRHAGATASGAPTTGTFAVGDYVVDQTGKMYVCTVAGTPGTWVQVGSPTTSVTMGGDVTGNSATSTVAKINGTTLGTLSGATSGQALAWGGSSWVPTTISGPTGTQVSSYITSSVTWSSGNQTVTSVNITAGTWLINWIGMASLPNSGNIVTIGLNDTTNTVLLQGGTFRSTANTVFNTLSGAYVYTVASTTNVALYFRANNTNVSLSNVELGFSAAPNATGLVATKLA